MAATHDHGLSVAASIELDEFHHRRNVMLGELWQILADLVPRELRVRMHVTGHTGFRRVVQAADAEICGPVLFRNGCLPDQP